MGPTKPPSHQQGREDIGRKDYSKEKPARDEAAPAGVGCLLVGVEPGGDEKKRERPSNEGGGDCGKDPYHHGTLLSGSPSLPTQESPVFVPLSSSFEREGW